MESVCLLGYLTTLFRPQRLYSVEGSGCVGISK